MSTATGSRRRLTDTSESMLKALGVQGALVAALVHLWMGAPALLVYLPALNVSDPRPYLFVPSALLLFVVLAGLYTDRAVRPLLVVGVVVLAGYFFGYAWWHLTDHGGLIPGGHTHESPVVVVAEHLLDDPLAFLSKVAELVGIVGFLGLLVGGYGRRAE